jgi:hypothetical protein
MVLKNIGAWFTKPQCVGETGAKDGRHIRLGAIDAVIERHIVSFSSRFSARLAPLRIAPPELLVYPFPRASGEARALYDRGDRRSMRS